MCNMSRRAREWAEVDQVAHRGYQAHHSARFPATFRHWLQEGLGIAMMKAALLRASTGKLQSSNVDEPAIASQRKV